MHNPLMSRERVVVPPRPDLSRKQKVAVWNAQNGICPRCLKPVPLEGLGVEYDHDVPREISADDSLGNLFAMHTACHSEKTRTADAPAIAKTRRQEGMTRPKVQKPSGFRKGPFYRGVDGQVRERR
jgi:hypothetical protein